MIVEEDHDDTRDVERGERRVDDEISVVKHAEGRIPGRGVIQAKDNRGADSGRNGPHEADSKPDPFMILVASVLYRLSHGNVPENM